MNNQIEPCRDNLITYRVRYDKMRVGLCAEFFMQAPTPEFLCEMLERIFPGRGSYSFDEVTQ